MILERIKSGTRNVSAIVGYIWEKLKKCVLIGAYVLFLQILCKGDHSRTEAHKFKNV